VAQAASSRLSSKSGEAFELTAPPKADTAPTCEEIAADASANRILHNSQSPSLMALAISEQSRSHHEKQHGLLQMMKLFFRFPLRSVGLALPRLPDHIFRTEAQCQRQGENDASE
jgi:hypothetical protein